MSEPFNDDAEFVRDDRVSRLPEPLREAMQKAMQELLSEGTTHAHLTGLFFSSPRQHGKSLWSRHLADFFAIGKEDDQ